MSGVTYKHSPTAGEVVAHMEAGGAVEWRVFADDDWEPTARTVEFFRLCRGGHPLKHFRLVIATAAAERVTVGVAPSPPAVTTLLLTLSDAEVDAFAETGLLRVETTAGAVWVYGDQGQLEDFVRAAAAAMGLVVS